MSAVQATTLKHGNGIDECGAGDHTDYSTRHAHTAGLGQSGGGVCVLGSFQNTADVCRTTTAVKPESEHSLQEHEHDIQRAGYRKQDVQRLFGNGGRHGMARISHELQYDGNAQHRIDGQ